MWRVFKPESVIDPERNIYSDQAQINNCLGLNVTYILLKDQTTRIIFLYYIFCVVLLKETFCDFILILFWYNNYKYTFRTRNLHCFRIYCDMLFNLCFYVIIKCIYSQIMQFLKLFLWFVEFVKTKMKMTKIGLNFRFRLNKTSAI